MCAFFEWCNVTLSHIFFHKHSKSSSSERGPHCGECLLLQSVCYMSTVKQHLRILTLLQRERGRCKLTLIIFLQTTQNEKLFTVAQYMYDALGRRIRLRELGKYENKTFTFDALLLFREVTKAMTRTPNRLILACSCCWSEVKKARTEVLKSTI